MLAERPSLGLALPVALGGALGSVFRHSVDQGMALWLLAATEPAFSSTFLVNALGSLLIGVLAVLTAQRGPLDAGPRLRAFVITGLLGGFTTASLFSLQVLTLIQDARLFVAASYVFFSFSICLMAAWAGYAVTWPLVHRRALIRRAAIRRAADHRMRRS